MLRRELILPEGDIYLDGNSLGPLPRASREAIERRVAEWGSLGVRGWEEWLALAESLAPKIARLVGAFPGEVIATGSITVNLHALLATFHRSSGARRNLLVTSLDFPSDRHAADSWAEQRGALVRVVPSRDGHTLDFEDVVAAMTDDVSLALLPTVLYRSGQLLDVRGLTRAAHERGIVVGWDAAHGIGAVPHALHDDGADFAVWCHYKYVCGGPGAPGGLFVHERHHARLPALRGWWGNAASSRFAMRDAFEKAEGAAAYQLGTPSILALAALEGALTLFDRVSLADVRTRSLALTDQLISLVDSELPEIRVVTPRPHAERGGHVALAHPDARRLSDALRARGIVPDYRAPDVLRLAPVALYNTEDEVTAVVHALRAALDDPGAGVTNDSPLVT